jgi:hypothetical protein
MGNAPTAGCCARAATGNAAALPTPAMKSRHRNVDLLLIPPAYRVRGTRVSIFVCTDIGVTRGCGDWRTRYGYEDHSDVALVLKIVVRSVRSLADRSATEDKPMR